jgi:hypothetical protein
MSAISSANITTTKIRRSLIISAITESTSMVSSSEANTLEKRLQAGPIEALPGEFEGKSSAFGTSDGDCVLLW